MAQNIELTWKTGYAGSTFSLDVEWFDHNNINKRTQVVIAIRQQDKPRELEVSVAGHVVAVETTQYKSLPRQSPFKHDLEHDSTVPTHQCTVCGALWRQWGDGSWNLRSAKASICCDNVAMGEQIAPLMLGQLLELVDQQRRLTILNN